MQDNNALMQGIISLLERRANYFERTTGHFDRKDAARSYRATVDEVSKLLHAQPAPASGEVALEHLTNVLFADPGPKHRAAERAAVIWWHQQDDATRTADMLERLAGTGQEGNPLGLDVDGMCDDHGTFGCKTCVDAFLRTRPTQQLGETVTELRRELSDIADKAAKRLPHAAIERQARAALAAMLPASPQWLPIESAPAEGQIIGWVPCEKRGDRIELVKMRAGQPFIVGGEFAFDRAPVTRWWPLPTSPAQWEG